MSTRAAPGPETLQRGFLQVQIQPPPGWSYEIKEGGFNCIIRDTNTLTSDLPNLLLPLIKTKKWGVSRSEKSFPSNESKYMKTRTKWDRWVAPSGDHREITARSWVMDLLGVAAVCGWHWKDRVKFEHGLKWLSIGTTREKTGVCSQLRKKPREPFSTYYKEERRSRRPKSFYLKIKDSSCSSLSDDISNFLIRLHKTLGSRGLLSCNQEK